MFMNQPAATAAPAEQTPTPKALGFRKDIEGLRAVAVTLVVAYHAGIPGFWGGFIGVDIFFVLSGYLITNLLLTESASTGAISLLGFYARRARRLLPASLLMLAVTAVLSALLYAPAEQRDIAETTMFTASYLSNFFFAKSATNYFGDDAESNPLLHTWSLSVEEQFYFVWPLLLMVALGVFPRRRVPAGQFAWVMAGVTALSFAASMALTLTNQPWAFFMMPPRAWEFGAGALAAVLPLRAGGRRPVALVTAGLGWLCVLGPAVFYNKFTLFPGYAAVVPVAGTVLLLRAGAGGSSWPTRILETRPFQAIGRLSYSWYLWHWPALLLAGAATSHLPGPYRVAAVTASLGLAALSYKFVEHPIRTHAGLAQKPRLAVLGAVGLSFLTVALALGWQRYAATWAEAPAQVRFTKAREDKPSRIYPDCNSTFPEAELKPCAFGPAGAPNTAVLLGDSHAAQWFSAFAETFERRGWRYVVMLKGGCPPIEHTFFNRKLGRTYRECDAWRGAALAEVERLAPDLVIAVASAHYDITAAQRETGTRKMLEALRGSAKHVVLLRDNPSPGYDVPACLARQNWRPAALPALTCRAVFPAPPRAAAVFEAQQRAAAGLENVTLLDLSDVLCASEGCRAYDERQIYYHDRDHLADQFVATLSPVFAARLAAALPELGAEPGAPR